MTKRIALMVALLILGVAVVACSSGGAATPQTIEVTVEVTRLVESTAAAQPVAVTFSGAGDTLKAVQDRGVLKCGGNANVPGFGYLDPDTGNFSGFDIDFCKAIAAAIFGEGGAEKIEITPATGQSRFPILQAGEIDVLIRNTTWTLSRDTALGFDFAPVTFYDGQGMMVRKSSNINSLADLEGGTVCVQAGTTTEKNLAEYFQTIGVNIESKVFPDAPSTLEAYDSGTCDGFTTDKSGLVSNQILLTDPTAHKILAEDMSREPLAPLTRHGDNNWNDVVSWVVQCTFNAEFLGVSQANVDDMLGGDNPIVSDLLGETGDLAEAMGLPNDFCYQVIKQVGNYADIYNRNLGPDTPFDLPRALNALYNNGGILYPIPFK